MAIERKPQQNRSHTIRAALRRGAVGLALVGLAIAMSVRSVAVVRAQQPAPPGALVFDDVTVIDVQQGNRLPDQRVVIVGNRISAMGSMSSVKVPAGAQVVNARGKFLIPGLWDMHTHSRRYTDFFYPLFLANGVTGIRDAWSEVPLDTTLMWRREIVAGTRVGPPRQLLPGPALDESQPCSRGEFGGHICVGDSADARHVVDSLKAAGADFIKTYQLGTEMYFVIAAEARRLHMPLGGHLNRGVATAIEASDSGVSIIDHINTAGDLYKLCLGKRASKESCQPVVDHFKHNGTWFVPTFIRFATESGDHDTRVDLTSDELEAIGMRTGPASEAILRHFYRFARDFWAGTAFHTDWLRDSAYAIQTSSAPRSPTDTTGFLRMVHIVGLPIMAGTDGGAPVMEPQPPGFALHAELAMFVAEGLTPLEALQTATLNPAQYLHGTDSLGTVATGKLADLVLLDADPLVAITNTTTIRAVIANGRYYDRATLDQLMADAQTKGKTEARPFGTARAD